MFLLATCYKVKTRVYSVNQCFACVQDLTAISLIEMILFVCKICKSNIIYLLKKTYSEEKKKKQFYTAYFLII